MNHMLARAPPRPLNVQRLRSELPPVSSSDTALVASVQLASLQNGHIIVPNATRYALIEIGTSDRDTYDDGRPARMAGVRPRSEDAYERWARAEPDSVESSQLISRVSTPHTPGARRMARPLS